MNDSAIVPVEQAQHLQSASDLAPKVKAMFPKDLNPEQALAVAQVAVQYGLDPLMQELIPYQGNPYVTTAGYIRIAERNAAYEGFEMVAATKDERVAYMVNDHESLWKCLVFRSDRRKPIVAFGRAGGAYDNSQPVAKQRVPEMAQNRALRRALRAAFPVPIPGQDEPITGSQIKALHAMDTDLGIDREQRHQDLQDTYGVEASNELTKNQATAYIDGRKVLLDVETGEVVDADDVVEAEAPADDDHDPHWNSDTVKRSIQKVIDERQATPVEAPDISNWTEFWHWAKGHGFKNASSVQDALGIDSVQDHTPADLASNLVDYLESEDDD